MVHLKFKYLDKLKTIKKKKKMGVIKIDFSERNLQVRKNVIARVSTLNVISYGFQQNKFIANVQFEGFVQAIELFKNEPKELTVTNITENILVYIESITIF